MASSSSSQPSQISSISVKENISGGFQNTVNFSQKELRLVTEKAVDFMELKKNGQDWRQNYLMTLRMQRYFDILNGPTYPNLVKFFWMRASVFDRTAAQEEEIILIEKFPDLSGKSRREMGLKDFTSTEIRSNIDGLDIAFTADHIVQLCRFIPSGRKLSEFQVNSQYNKGFRTMMVNQDRGRLNAVGRTHLEIFRASIVPTMKVSEKLCWEHKMFLYLTMRNHRINVGKFIFEDIFKTNSPLIKTIYPPSKLQTRFLERHGFIKCFNVPTEPMVLTKDNPRKLEDFPRGPDSVMEAYHKIKHQEEIKSEEHQEQLKGVGEKARMTRGIVRRLSCGAEVQKLCCTSIECFDLKFSELFSSCAEKKEAPSCHMMNAICSSSVNNQAEVYSITSEFIKFLDKGKEVLIEDTVACREMSTMDIDTRANGLETSTSNPNRDAKRKDWIKRIDALDEKDRCSG
ncbi:hypothetical protein TSUD_348570 [Trifolium subterraneum]|uniref:Uncharacterized protein n=1 Tax=Trifolium subterraneum TaxID=3900 RepID=A0A2Z6NH26_TRISU|nr:hypothetical protein TSUD_348570 [Trifolium subterraneum]